jgi:hypothetical protein
MANRRDQDLRNMDYKRDRDRLSLENTRLSLLNQGNVVHAITNLADAIKAISTPRSPETKKSTHDWNTSGTAIAARMHPPTTTETSNPAQ